MYTKKTDPSTLNPEPQTPNPEPHSQKQVNPSVRITELLDEKSKVRAGSGV